MHINLLEMGRIGRQHLNMCEPDWFVRHRRDPQPTRLHRRVKYRGRGRFAKDGFRRVPCEQASSRTLDVREKVDVLRSGELNDILVDHRDCDARSTGRVTPLRKYGDGTNAAPGSRVKDPDDVQVRAAVASDADGIALVFVESAAHHARLDPDRYSVPTAASISARYRTGEHQQGIQLLTGNVTLVAELRGEIVGFVDARLDRSPDPMHRDLLYCHIGEIAVSAEHQSRGIGGRLLRAAEDWGRHSGAEFAYLEYHADNLRAGAFYQQRMGYRVAALAAIRRL
jgi:ribosomal protein S18 acetylase RimI-like enzyme